MLEIIITMVNLYAHNVISYKKGGFIIEIEKLADKIIKYQSNYNWYELVDNYGNIELDDDARKKILEESIMELQNNPDTIISYLKTIIEELECNNNYEEDEEYKETKELIDEIEKFRTEQIDENLEM